MFRLSSSMADRINFDRMAKNVLEEARFFENAQLIKDVELYFDLNTDFVDDVEEAEARVLDVAKQIIKEANEEGKFKLNRDWKSFEVALCNELKKLNATGKEQETILESAFQDATDVDDVAQYAQEELELVRQ